VLWFVAAFWPVPKIGSTIGDLDKLDALARALKWQSRFNATAALATAVAILLQVWSTF
jgi:hypothetical protein